MKLNPAQLGEPWTATAVIGGTEIYLRSPIEVEADEHGSSRGGLLRLPLTAIRAVASALFGVRALPGLRKVCRELTTPPYHPIIDRMNGGELALLYHIYLGAQRGWYLRIAAAASRRVERGDEKPPAAAPAPPARSATPAKLRQVHIPIVPGRARLTDDGVLRVHAPAVEAPSSEV